MFRPIRIVVSPTSVHLMHADLFAAICDKIIPSIPIHPLTDMHIIIKDSRNWSNWGLWNNK